ncbi:MAG: hypothetical protein ACI4CS_01520 [Candidatus Weimeria sp.]
MALNFRTTGMKKTTKHRIILLVVIFFISLLFFYIILNRKTSLNISSMSAPKLPTVSVESFGTKQLLLHGYTSKMDDTEMTDSLIPLDTDRKLTITVNTYGNQIDGASYEIHSTDTSRTISTDTLNSSGSSGNTATFDAEFTNLLDPGKKYTLILKLTSGGKKIRYYSQIMIYSDSHLKELMKFASDFHEKSLSSDYDTLGKYLETSSDTTASEDISHVTINSTINELGMQSFSHKVESDPVISVTDLTDDVASIEICYILGHNDSRYLATEKYRIRYGSPRMYLLSFDRTLDIIPDSDTFSVKDGAVIIGASADSPQMYANESGSVAAFVQAGALYEYNVNQNKVTSVFSFFKDSDDQRCLFTDHDIRILNIDASGSMDFVVYGYMNCGSHEGRSGIDIYHYDSSLNVATEEGFINSTNPLSYLQHNFSELLYRTSGGRFYCLLNHNLIGIDLSTRKTDVMLSNLQDGQYCVSEDMRYIAWTKSSQPGSVIKVRDLSSDKVYRISAKSGTRLKTLAFIDDDLVYGTVDSSHYTSGLMNSLTIVSFANERMSTIKTYQKDGLLISKISRSDNALKLTRVKTDGSSASSDTILDTLTNSDESVNASTAADDDAGTVRTIIFSKLSTDLKSKPAFTTSGLVLSDSTISLEIYK